MTKESLLNLQDLFKYLLRTSRKIMQDTSKCSKPRASCQCVNVSPCLRVPLHREVAESLQKWRSPFPYSLDLRSSPNVSRDPRSVAGSWTMKRVLGFSPAVKNEAYPVGRDLILELAYPQKGGNSENRVFHVEGQSMVVTTLDILQIEENPLWSARGANSSHLKWIATFPLRFCRQYPQKASKRAWKWVKSSVTAFLW